VIRAEGEHVISESQYRALLGNGTTAEMKQAYEWLHLQLSPSLEPIANHSMWVDRLADLSRYIDERGSSGLPDSGVELRFDGRALRAGNLSWTAVSGRPVLGNFDYSPQRQRDQGEGPVPEGAYWVDPRQVADLRDRWFYSFRFEDSWGTHRLTIHPLHSTHTFGRGGFFIHGGTSPGSRGCIDLTSEMANFANWIAKIPRGEQVRLTVDYGNAPATTPAGAPP
jgi:hypothetical protein